MNSYVVQDWKKYLYTFRITIRPLGEAWSTHLATFVELLHKEGSIYHVGDLHVDGTQTHFHGLFSHWSRDRKKVGPWVRDQFPGCAKSFYECTPWEKRGDDEFAYHKYVMKTGVLYTTFPDEQVSQWLAVEQQRQADYQRELKNQQNKREREKKKTRDDHYDRLVSVVVPEFLRTHTTDVVSIQEWYPVDMEYVTIDQVVPRSNHLRLEDCTRLVVHEYRDSFFTMNLLEPVVHRLMLKFNPDYESDLSRRLFERLTR